MTPIGAGEDEQPEVDGGGKHEPRRGHQQRADDQHPPAAEPIGAGRQEQRHDGVADERQRQQQADLRFGQAEADQIEHQHDRQRAVREQPDESRGEQQPAIAIEMGERAGDAHPGAGHDTTLTQKSGSRPEDTDNIVDTSMRVLVVEDERKLREVLATALQSEQYDDRPREPAMRDSCERRKKRSTWSCSI